MTTLKLQLHDLLSEAFDRDTIDVPAAVDLAELLEFNDVHTAKIDLDDLLAEQRMIASIWSVADVLELRPDLSQDQAWEVLQKCRADYDHDQGLNRLIVARVAESLFSGGQNRRANRCQKVLATYNDEWDAENSLVDFLTDSRHWCDVHEKSYADLDRRAHQHYLAELEQGGRV